MIVTYVTPTEKPSGFSSVEVARQIVKMTMKQHYRFSRVSGGTTTFTVYDSSSGALPYSIVIAGLPSATLPPPQAVDDNSVVLVSDATCN
jgi:hypothetical protein